MMNILTSVFRQKNYSLIVLLLVSSLLFQTELNAQVKVYEGKEIIPTYKIGKEEPSPIFYTGRGVQGAEGRMYPYPSQAKLGDSLADVTYNMVYLENEYLKVKILPAFGGRLFSAIDKTNGHELFHTNSVIKPSLIGTLGAWVSGGIEWCFPHHHRTTTMLPSDYRLVQNKDGSATVWIGETEKTMRIRGVVGITLKPGCSYIETDYRINNTNALTKTFLFWANVAITANEDFRTFWPPSQELGVYHNNTGFIRWPISNETKDYGRTSYREGVDLTWWKNHPNPVSFFMWDIKEGFIGGYDYGKKAGTIHVGDIHKNNASKLWQFGPGLQGRNARRQLTDDGKAYVELMTGTFSNNQPDYSWIAPHSVKDAKNYWYPLQDIEVVKNSTIDASVTLQMRNSKTVFYGFNTTKAFKNARVLLKHNDDILVEKQINISPSTPFTATYTSKNKIDELKLHIVLVDNNDNELVAYSPYKSKQPELPETQEKVKKPKEIESVEDLYLTGRFVEQFNRPGINPDDYYLEALKKSPQDYRVNIALGKRRLNQTKYQEALGYFQVAANKLKVKYFQPKEGEIYYYSGLAHKEVGNLEEAYKNLARSTWYYEWFSAGNFQLALLESKKGNINEALKYIEDAYSTNNLDGRIVVLYSALLRQVGKNQKALELINNLIAYDPLDFAAFYELHLLKANTPFKKWRKNMQDIDNNYLEIAVNYMNAGLLDDGIKLLSTLENPNNPLIPYYLSWFYSQDGNQSKSIEKLEVAKQISLDYCFPYRQETEHVLKNAIKLDSKNASAYYLLGNLFFDNRKEEAMQAWTKANEIDNSIAMVNRNLAFGSFYYEKDIDSSIKNITKAIESDNTNPLWYSELSKYYKASNLNFKACLDILKENIEIVKKDVSAPKTYIELLNLNGEYEAAINFLNSHHFRTWEGGREIYWHYVNSHVLRALQLIKVKKYDEAINHLELSLIYPENLEVGKSENGDKNAMIYYFMGYTYSLKNDKKSAETFYQKSVSSKNGMRMYDLIYFQAKSYDEIGDKEKADELFKSLINLGKEIRIKGQRKTLVAVEEGTSNNNEMISNTYYLEALGNKGLKNNKEAQELFEKALKAYNNNLWVRIMIKNN